MNIGGSVLIVDGNSDHAAHEWRKIGLFEEKKSDLWLLSDQMPLSDQIKEIAPYVHISELPSYIRTMIGGSVQGHLY